MKNKVIIVFILTLMLITTIMPVTLSINEKNLVPDLVYSPTSHDFGSVEEGETYYTTFDIWNGGTDTLTWNLGIVHTWVSPSPTSGSSTGEHDTVTVTIDTTGLTPGSHSGFVSISANDGGGLRYFMINLNINNPPNTPSKPFGPTNVDEGISYLYTTSSIDPDGDNVKYGFDFNNDGIIEPSHWTSYIPSGATCNLWVTFYGAVKRYVRVKAEDIHGAQSDFSLALTIIVSGSNHAPNTPNTPSGPISGTVGISYSYITSSTDPDSDDVKYGWDWDGDGIVDEWTILYSSGTIITTSHTWSSSGVYNVQVKAEDSNGAQSSFSPFTTVTITSSNNPPYKPSINGPASGKTGDSYTYNVLTIDIDDDQVYYWIDWDDGSDSGWIGPFDSGLSVSKSHVWSANGSYSIRVKSKDINGAESPWSDPLSVTMPKTQSFELLSNFRIWFSERFPILQKYISKYS